MTRVGLISDTHGLLRPQALAALEGCDHIIHGGDIGNAHILTALSALAPVTAVRGNNDREDWAAQLPEAITVRILGIDIHVLHDASALGLHPAPPATRVIVSGHSHKPVVREASGVLHVNPGSAGPRRFKLPIAVGELTLHGDSVDARIVELQIPPTTGRRR